jgi:hypothetical protein
MPFSSRRTQLVLTTQFTAVFALSVQARYAAKLLRSSGGDTTAEGSRVNRRLPLRESERWAAAKRAVTDGGVVEWQETLDRPHLANAGGGDPPRSAFTPSPPRRQGRHRTSLDEPSPANPLASGNLLADVFIRE